jgi:uncharacterized protein YodC (DUF2158 family)
MFVDEEYEDLVLCRWADNGGWNTREFLKTDLVSLTEWLEAH